MAEDKTTRLTTSQPAVDSDEVARLKAENARLRAQLAEKEGTEGNARPEPQEPSYGISEGQRADLEQDGRTVSPFTGALQVGDGEPGAAPKVVDADEFAKAKKTE